jgi:hypothetical protein
MKKFRYSVLSASDSAARAKFRNYSDAVSFSQKISKTRPEGVWVLGGKTVLATCNDGKVVGSDEPCTLGAVVSDKADVLKDGDPVRIVNCRGKTFVGIMRVFPEPASDRDEILDALKILFAAAANDLSYVSEPMFGRVINGKEPALFLGIRHAKAVLDKAIGRPTEQADKPV